MTPRQAAAAVEGLRLVMQHQGPMGAGYLGCPWLPRGKLLATLAAAGASTGAAARILRRLVAAGALEVRGAAGQLEYRWPVDSAPATSTDARPTSPRGETGPRRPAARRGPAAVKCSAPAAR